MLRGKALDVAVDSAARNWRIAMDRYGSAMPVDRIGTAAVYEALRPIATANSCRADGSDSTAELRSASLRP